MGTLDSIRDRFGHKLIMYRVQGVKEVWALKQENASPCYTTRVEELIRVR
jgi:DNA polymerase V